jgi:hypothetical protein
VRVYSVDAGELNGAPIRYTETFGVMRADVHARWQNLKERRRMLGHRITAVNDGSRMEGAVHAVAPT